MATPAAPIEFYYAPICPFAHRAWLALELLGLPYAGTVIDLANKAPEFVALYPQATGASKGGPAKVPVIRDGDFLLTESAVITEYLINKYGGRSEGFTAALDAKSRALTSLMVEQCSGPIIKGFYSLLSAQEAEAQGKAAAELLAAFATFSATLEATSSGPFFLGEKPSLGDVLVFPWPARVGALKSWRGFSVPDEPQYKAFNAWCAAMLARPEVQKTMMDDDFYAKGYEAYAVGARTPK